MEPSSWGYGLLCATLLSQPGAGGVFTVDAKVDGYNLLDPCVRCCAFSVSVSADGEIASAVDGPSGRSVSTRKLSGEELDALRAAVLNADFLSLPETLPLVIPTDADRHWMRVRLGQHEHEVTLYGWTDDLGAGITRENGCAEVERAVAVWMAIRSLVPVEEEAPCLTVP